MRFLLGLNFTCKKCQKENRIKGWATDRYRLRKRMGMEPVLRCKTCGKEVAYHVNRIYVKERFLVLPIYLAFVLSSYFLGSYAYSTYWRGNVLIDNKVISVVFGAYLLPIVILGVLFFAVGRTKDILNSGRIPYHR